MIKVGVCLCGFAHSANRENVVFGLSVVSLYMCNMLIECNTIYILCKIQFLCTQYIVYARYLQRWPCLAYVDTIYVVSIVECVCVVLVWYQVKCSHTVHVL